MFFGYLRILQKLLTFVAMKSQGIYISKAGLHILGKFSFLGTNFLIFGMFFSE